MYCGKDGIAFAAFKEGGNAPKWVSNNLMGLLDALGPL
jgi:hypothetical protein